MTTEVNFDADVRASHAWPILRNAQDSEHLAALEMVRYPETIGHGPESAMVALSGFASQILFVAEPLRDLAPTVFLASETWQPDSALVRRKGLWHSLTAPLDVDVFPSRSHEVVFHEDAGLRFAALLRLDDTNLLSALEAVRRSQTAALVIGRSDVALTEARVSELYASAFGSDRPSTETRSLDWSRFTRMRSMRGEIVGRVEGEFDDRGVAFQLFGNTDLLSEAHRAAIGLERGGV